MYFFAHSSAPHSKSFQLMPNQLQRKQLSHNTSLSFLLSIFFSHFPMVIVSQYLSLPSVVLRVFFIFTYPKKPINQYFKINPFWKCHEILNKQLATQHSTALSIFLLFIPLNLFYLSDFKIGILIEMHSFDYSAHHNYLSRRRNNDIDKILFLLQIVQVIVSVLKCS